MVTSVFDMEAAGVMDDIICCEKFKISYETFKLRIDTGTGLEDMMVQVSRVVSWLKVSRGDYTPCYSNDKAS